MNNYLSWEQFNILFPHLQRKKNEFAIIFEEKKPDKHANCKKIIHKPKNDNTYENKEEEVFLVTHFTKKLAVAWVTNTASAECGISDSPHSYAGFSGCHWVAYTG